MYARIHGTITWHRKTLAVDDASLGVLMRLLGHCAEHLTDGDVPEPVAVAIASRSPHALEALTRVGWLERTADGFKVANYVTHNVTRDEIERSRAAAKERKAKSREKQASRATHSQVTESVTRESQRPSRVTGRVTSASVTLQEEEVEVEVLKKEEDTSGSHPTTLIPIDGGKRPDEVRKVFDHWRDVLGHPRAVLDGKRRRRIETALKSHGLATVLAAVDGCARSDWHMGRDPATNGKRYDDLELILRDASKIERFASDARTAVPAVESSSQAVVFHDGVNRKPTGPTLAERWALAAERAKQVSK